MDTWVIWNLTGGTDGGLHITDVSNASRTMLMDLATSDWDDELLDAIGVPRAMLPEVKGSSEVYGEATLPAVQGVPVAGDLGDQQAALFGQTCFAVGRGQEHLRHRQLPAAQHRHHAGALEERPHHHGRLPDRRRGPRSTRSRARSPSPGALVQWLRDNLKMIKAAPDVEELAKTVDDNGGVYFVPAFSGLFAPYWRSDARGVIAGLTRYVTAGHIARAVLEATAYQSREVVEAMNADSGVDLESLKVDGGMVAERPAHAVPVRPARRGRHPARRGRDHGARGRLRRRPGGRHVDGAGGPARELGRGQALDARRWTPPSGRRRTAFWKKAVTKSFDWVEDEGGG